MNFAELKTELKARGFDYLSDTRAGQFINWARGELDDLALWPYRQTSSTGTADAGYVGPADLGPIIKVYDVLPSDPVELRFVDYRGMTSEEFFGDDTSSPYGWYMANGQVVGIPNTGTIRVHYYKLTADLSGTQTPEAPSRFHDIIVDIAARNAYLDKDNPQAAEALQAKIDRRVAQMMDALLDSQLAGPSSFTVVTGASEDW